MAVVWPGLWLGLRCGLSITRAIAVVRLGLGLGLRCGLSMAMARA